jgi:hypothetical protein
MGMISVQTGSLLIGCAGLVLVAFSSIPAVCSITQRFTLRRQRASSQGLYQDEDGCATAESAQAFSNKFQQGSIAVLSTLGSLLALVQAMMITVNHPERLLIEHWLYFGIWVCFWCFSSRPR